MKKYKVKLIETYAFDFLQKKQQRRLHLLLINICWRDQQ